MAKKSKSVIGQPGYQAEGNILMTIGKFALAFQQAVDVRNNARSAMRAMFKEYTRDTDGWFDPDDHIGDEEYLKTFEAIERYKVAAKLVPGARAKMKRAIRVYREYMENQVASASKTTPSSGEGEA